MDITTSPEQPFAYVPRRKLPMVIPPPAPSNKFISQVEPGLFIGNYQGAANLELLTSHNIRRVIQFHDRDPTPNFPGHFNYLTYALPNQESTQLISVFRTALPFLRQGIEQGESVFVHCKRGASRSGSVIIAYLMATRDLSYQEACRVARGAREYINPSKWFIKQFQRITKENCRECYRL
jgi:dual specificity MAP kinase phosphatase